jgi:hypothetical protein
MDRVAIVREAFAGASGPSLFSPHFVTHTPWDRLVQHLPKSPTEPGRAMFSAKKVFADCAVSMDDAFENGDKVVVRWTLRGTWTQPIPGIVLKPTGRPINLAGISVYQFKGDQIVAKYGEFDVAAFHAQACAPVADVAQECARDLVALAGVRS